MKKWIKNIVILSFISFIFFTMASVLNEPSLESEHQMKWAEGYEDTAAQNLVTAIYLDYRLFDTFLEATILFVAVGGIIFMSKEDQDVT